MKLLDAAKAIKALENAGALTRLGRLLIENAPSIDPESLRLHGRWVKQECQGDYGRCSLCECRIPWIQKNYTYCPSCGAKMDLEG